MPGLRVAGGRVGREQARPLLRRQRPDPEGEARGRVVRLLDGLDQEEEVGSVGQDLREAMGRLAALRVERRDRYGGPARRRHAEDRIGRGGREEDRPVAGPRASAARCRRAEHLGRAAVRVDLPELPAGEEAEEAAVGRPEGERRVLGPRERLGREGVERPDPEHRSAVAGPGDERDPAPVGREGHRARLVVEARLLGREERRADDARGLLRGPHEAERRDERDEGGGEKAPGDDLAPPPSHGSRRGDGRLSGVAGLDGGEREPRLADVAKPALRVALEAAAEKELERGRRRGRQLREVDLALEDAGERVADRVGREELTGPSASRGGRRRTPRCRPACRPCRPSPARAPCRPRCRG